MSGQISLPANLSGQIDQKVSGCCGKTKSGKSCKWRSTTAYNGGRYCKHHIPRDEKLGGENDAAPHGGQLELKLELCIKSIRVLGGNKCEFVFA
jgi:hypothetical protein